MLHAGLDNAAIVDMVGQMCELQRHGGPDDGGLFAEEAIHLVLGNRRLALQDLSRAGHQPMQYLGNQITYNGEVYNFPELREELKLAGHTFHTHTDTEVILAAYSQWGVQAFSRFKGMFAFALWDAGAKELLLVRDAAGIKPLYYSSHSEGISFASEIKAFQPLKEGREANPNWPVYQLAFGHLPEPVSTLKQVQSLPKGCFLKYHAPAKSLTLQSFRHYSFSNSIGEKETAVEQIRATLNKSVKRHMIADAPLGVFLSGGLDSSIVTKIAAEAKQENLNSLSIYFSEDAYSEKRYQDLLLENTHCKPNQFLLEEHDFQSAFPTILKAMDQPSCDGINTWFISKHARELGLKAVLSGIGADELFGGYPSFKRMGLAFAMQRCPSQLLGLGQKSGIRQFNRLSYLKMDGVKGLYLFLRGHFTPREIATQLGGSEKEIWQILDASPVLQDISNLSMKNQASWMEINLYLQNQLLRDADCMGMAHGVEIRVPFLDDDFISLAHHISPGIKFGGERPKQLLIDAYQDSLPAAIWNRPKMGFSFPFSPWLSKSEFVKALMDNADQPTRDNYKNFLQGKLHWSRLMSLIILKSGIHAV
ncbi:MAG: asnB [Ferruginibacter sp.]|nr:asnB [Ferruginibacter sp.]